MPPESPSALSLCPFYPAGSVCKQLTPFPDPRSETLRALLSIRGDISFAEACMHHTVILSSVMQLCCDTKESPRLPYRATGTNPGCWMLRPTGLRCILCHQRLERFAVGRPSWLWIVGSQPQQREKDKTLRYDKQPGRRGEHTAKCIGHLRGALSAMTAAGFEGCPRGPRLGKPASGCL